MKQQVVIESAVYISEKIVKIAELYEKKQICKEKYSTEILCDYILDKSKK